MAYFEEARRGSNGILLTVSRAQYFPKPFQGNCEHIISISFIFKLEQFLILLLLSCIHSFFLRKQPSKKILLSSNLDHVTTDSPEVGE